jgi:putative PIN family toxin of toxin-antitoxin system
VIRATIDTSVLAPAIRRANQTGYALAPILQAWRAGIYDLIVSAHLLDELQRTLATPYISRHLTVADRQATLDLFRYDAILVELTATVHGVATHPEDDAILATAVSGQADYLVPNDRQLLRLAHYRDVTIVTPWAFLAILQEDARR